MKKDKKICGVYMWVNKLTNIRYIGISGDIYKRWKVHEQLINSGKDRKFYNNVRELGIHNFDKIIIEEYDEYDEVFLKQREDYYINLYDTINNGYNIGKGYNNITDHPNIDGIKKKISDKAKRRKWINNGEKNITCDIDNVNEYLNKGWVYGRLNFSDNHKESLKISHIGHNPTKETRDKLSLLWLGRKHKESSKKLLSNITQGRYTMKWYIDKYGEEQGIVKYSNHHNHYKNKDKKIICINDGVINKMINEKELDEYINNNWKKGKLKK